MSPRFLYASTYARMAPACARSFSASVSETAISTVRKFPSVAEKKSQDAITFAVTAFLADLRLSGSERVLGALAIALAEAMDSAPGYAKGKLVRELREVLVLLAEAELSPKNLALLAGIEQ
jgi:hypothetical protein